MSRARWTATAGALILGASLTGWLALGPSQEAAGAGSGTPEAGSDTRTGDQDTPPPAAQAEEPTGQTGQTAQQAIVDHNTSARGPRQPIPFSHRFHATELRIDCQYCHTGIERTQTGTLPPLDVCMGCHRVAGSGLDPIDELRTFWERNEPVAWEWVYKLPEFVQFTHRPHLRAGVECQECHGPVEEMDRVYQWAPLTMGWCLECHRSEPAETDVGTDAALTRAEGVPPALPGADERQEESLYPRSIDTEYGAWRGPIDCLACHY